MRTPWRLVAKHLAAHWVRSGLTMVAMVLALFLFCFVTSIVTTLDNAVSSAASNRLMVQSAVSLFVDLPLNYYDKIKGVPGVAEVSRLQWFGGYYREPEEFFAQFAIDHEVFFEMYEKDLAIVEGPGGVAGEGAREAALAALASERRGTIVGTKLMEDFGWEVGQTVPIIPRIFLKADRSAWEFVICGVYEPLKTNVDPSTMWFRWDYFDETLKQQAPDMRGCGVYVIEVADGYDPATVIAAVDGLFAGGPQRTKTTTEAAFQAIFVSMLGDVPAFMGSIGGAIVFAVLFSVVNTMLMAARQRRQEAGILKALGFGNGALALLLVGESLVLSVVGGGLGLLLAKSAEGGVRAMLGSQLPGYAVEWRTVAFGAAITVLVGFVGGLGPAIATARVKPVDALRSEG